MLALVVVATVPHATTATLLWTIALTRWTELARLVRAEVLLSLGTDYVTAARALGTSPLRVLWRHVMPNAVGAGAGRGGVRGRVGGAARGRGRLPARGGARHDGLVGRGHGRGARHPEAWWLVAFPGAALLAALVALNLVG